MFRHLGELCEPLRRPVLVFLEQFNTVIQQVSYFEQRFQCPVAAQILTFAESSPADAAYPYHFASYRSSPLRRNYAVDCLALLLTPCSDAATNLIPFPYAADVIGVNVTPVQVVSAFETLNGDSVVDAQPANALDDATTGRDSDSAHLRLAFHRNYFASMTVTAILRNSVALAFRSNAVGECWDAGTQYSLTAHGVAGTSQVMAHHDVLEP